MKQLIGFLFVMVAISFARGETDETDKSQSILIRLVRQTRSCAQQGEYCQTHSDCCSKSCLSFSYKCTQIHKPVQEENQRPTSNEDITNRFTAVTNTANNTCAESGAYCQHHQDCCSRNCNRFSYQCGHNHGLSLQQQHFSSVLNPAAPQSANTVDTLINRFASNGNSVGNRNDVDNANGNSICRRLNQQCYSDSECCQGQCDYTSRTCLLASTVAPVAVQQVPTLPVRNNQQTQQNTQQQNQLNNRQTLNNQQQNQFINQQNQFNNQNFPQFGQLPQLYPQNIPNRLGFVDASPIIFGQSSRDCSSVGSKCSQNTECCTSRCHSFLHQCVT